MRRGQTRHTVHKVSKTSPFPDTATTLPCLYWGRLTHLLDQFGAIGGHRVEARVGVVGIEVVTEAWPMAWAERLGSRRESVLPGYDDVAVRFDRG